MTVRPTVCSLTDRYLWLYTWSHSTSYELHYFKYTASFTLHLATCLTQTLALDIHTYWAVVVIPLQKPSSLFPEVTLLLHHGAD